MLILSSHGQQNANAKEVRLPVMFLKNLVAEKAMHRCTNQDIANVLGVSRATYEQKMRTGRFTLSECKKLMRYFNKDFAYLFATDDEKGA